MVRDRVKQMKNNKEEKLLWGKIDCLWSLKRKKKYTSTAIINGENIYMSKWIGKQDN